MKSKTILNRTLLLTSICGLLVTTPPLRAADRLQSGQWEFTLTGNGASHTISQCITPAEAGGMNGDTKRGRAAAEIKGQGRCKVKSFDIQGDTVTYSLVCGDRTIDSTTTYHGDTSEGVLKTTTNGKVDTKTVKAHRVGACP